MLEKNMSKNNREHEHEHEYEDDHMVSNTMRVVVGLMIGSLAGAVTMLLLAPQSGKRTRALIQRKGIELREQASDSLDSAMGQVRVKARQITHNISDKAEELQERGQDMIDAQKENLSSLRESGKKVLQGSRA
jgi:gas vesicle protein